MNAECRVQVGDVWRDNDPRSSGREVIVESLDPAGPNSGHANCKVRSSGRHVRIRVQRLLAGAKYTLMFRTAKVPTKEESTP